MFSYDGAQTVILTDRQVRLPRSLVTIGAFDGVHRGHQTLVRGAIRDAQELGVPSVVWTFDPPPKVFFGRARPLCTLEEKLVRLARMGPDVIVVSRFSETYCRRSAEAFLGDLGRVNPMRIHVGADFRFGSKQAGTVALLAQHFDVAIAPEVRCDGGEVISSTRIRALRADGDSATAKHLLGADSDALRLSGAMAKHDLRLGEEYHVSSD